MDEQLVPKRAGSGSRDPFKNCCDWICTEKGDHQVGNLHVNCQHLVSSTTKYWTGHYISCPPKQIIGGHAPCPPPRFRRLWRWLQTTAAYKTAWKDSSLKWPIMSRVGLYSLSLSYLNVDCRTSLTKNVSPQINDITSITDGDPP